MHHSSKTWLVLFDTTSCRMYHYNGKQLLLIKDLEHPDNKKRDIELTSDKPGRYRSREQHGAYTQETDPKAIKIDAFAREIAKVLLEEKNTIAFEHLILVGLPHMMGLLNKHMNKHVNACVVERIEKDLMHLSDAELLNHF